MTCPSRRCSDVELFAPHGAGDDLSGVDANTHGEFFLRGEAVIDRIECFDHAKASAYGVGCMRWIVLRGPEDGHDCIADILVDDALVFQNGFGGTPWIEFPAWNRSAGI